MKGTLALAFSIATAVGIVTLVLVRTFRPDREAKGLTELCVLLAAFGTVYGSVGIGFVLQYRHGPDSRICHRSLAVPSWERCSLY